MNLKKYTNESWKTLILYVIDVILRHKNLENGLITTSRKKIEKEGDFICEPERLGFVEKRILNEKGDYRAFRPEGQQQNIGKDKMYCVSESACNSIQTNVNYLLHKVENGTAEKDELEIVNILRHFGVIVNNNGKEECLISTRQVAAGSGTTIRGNGQKAVADFIHNHGIIPDSKFPYVSDWNEYYYTGDYRINGNKVFKENLDLGEKIAGKENGYIEINYQWVYPNNIIGTLIYGALQTVGYCWAFIVNGVFQRNSYRANHAFQTDAFVNNIFASLDSYPPFAKKLAKNFFKNNAMLYTIKLKKPLENPRTKLLKDGTKFVLRADNHGEFYVVKNDKLEYVPTQPEIKKVVKDDTNLNADLIELLQKKILKTVNEKEFEELNN